MFYSSTNSILGVKLSFSDIKFAINLGFIRKPLFILKKL